MFVVSETYYFNNELETTFEGILKMMLIQPLLVKKTILSRWKESLKKF